MNKGIALIFESMKGVRNPTASNINSTSEIGQQLFNSLNRFRGV